MLLRLSLNLLILAVAIGCSTRYSPELHFNPAEPIRIAVLPFTQVDSSGSATEEDPTLLIDTLPLLSSKITQSPAQFMQDLVQSELTQASLDVVPPSIVDALLHHSTYEISGSKPLRLNVARLMQADPKELCSTILSCDALLYGNVTRWDRSYYGVESVATVGLDLKLISAKNGKLLFQTSAQDSDSRGISKGPTGLSNLVIEPLQGLDNEIITDLARSMVSKAIAPLTGRSRPEFLSTPAPVIIAAAHSAPSGVLPPRGRLLIAVYGTAGLRGSFDIGTFVQGVPLAERSAGHYVGEFIPLESDSFSDAIVSITLRDQFGRATTHHVTRKPISYR